MALPKLVVCCLEFFHHGEWEDIQLAVAEHPQLRGLAEQLTDIVSNDRAPATNKKYLQAFARWARWASSFNIQSLPAKAANICLYFVYLAQSARTASPIKSAFYGIAWAHEKAGLPDPTWSPLLQQTKHGLERMLAHNPDKKLPLLASHVRQIVGRFIDPTTDLDILQTVTLITLGYASFLRWDELHRMVFSDVSFFEAHMSIFVESRKNDQFREGHWVFVARMKSSTCAVALLERFFLEGGHGGDQLVFRKLYRSGDGKARLREEAMTYSRALEKIRNCFDAIGLDVRNYALHSLRAGGASAAASAGVPDRLFRRHGGWRSEKAKDGYIQESLDSLLMVTKNIGL